ARFHLGLAAAPVFVEETCDQERLDHQRGCNQDDLPVVLLPGSRGTKPNFAPERQSVLADAPPLQLGPIENGPYNFFTIGNRNVGGILSIENAQRKPSRHPPDASWTDHRTTNAALPDKRFAINESRPVGSFGNKLTGFVRKIPFSINIGG